MRDSRWPREPGSHDARSGVDRHRAEPHRAEPYRADPYRAETYGADPYDEPADRESYADDTAWDGVPPHDPRGRRRPPPPSGARKAARGVGLTVRFTAHATALGSRAAARTFMRSTRAEGAGESGLASLIDLHTVHSAADAMLAVALANTLFFAVSATEARSKVAIYLLVTMAPFALVAPVIGPLLDRFRNGRRYALATTQIVRAFLCWVMAGAIASKGGFALYPAAFGALVCSKAYGVTRSAVVPRVLPPSVTLVRGNARLTLWGTVAATIAAPLGQGVAWATGSPAWTLRLATLIYLAGAVFAFRLPARVDSNAGEARLRGHDDIDDGADGEGRADDGVPAYAYTETQVIRLPPPRQRPRSLFRRVLPPLRGVGSRMPTMLRAIAGLRAFSGFLTLFLAFLVRTRPLGVFSPNIDLGIVVAAAALGSGGGTMMGARLKARQPQPLAVTAVSVTAALGIVTAIWFGIFTAALVMLVAGLASSIGKLGLDSVIQHDVAEEVRTSTFARSETVLQLSWVLGGFLAIILPSNGSLGLALGSFVLLVVLAKTLHSIRTSPDRGIEALRRRRTRIRPT